MSSTERAPEPTMEEILASIRRIISDDESSSTEPSPASASQQGGEAVEAQEGEADERIISDIARVLSDTAPAVEDEEDILDLTAELGGPEPVEEAAPVETSESESVQPEPETAPPVMAEAPVAEAEAPAASDQPPMSASEEAASALERAIAALRAGQVPTSVSEFMPAPEPAPEPEAAAEAEPSEPEAALEFAPEPERDTIPEPEEPMVTSEFAAEVIVEETVEVEALPAESAEDAPERGAAPEETASWMESPAALAEPEPQAARGNGGEHGASPLDSAHKTLEDSVKDLLRPMLKQWLDENMPRMLTAALKDELGDAGPRRRHED